MKDICFWSIGDQKHAIMLQTLVDSFHAVGMQEDFHAISDRPIKGATTHLVDSFLKACFMFKFGFLYQMRALDYRYFVFLDADSYFVRRPPNLIDLMAGDPLHSFLECDCTAPDKNILRKTWRGCPWAVYIQLLREKGVTHKKLYNVNGGFFMVEREAIEHVCQLALDFWLYAKEKGIIFTEEAPLAYATQLLCKDPSKHLIINHFDVWATDWTGRFADHLPGGEEWVFSDWITGKPYLVNPSIVHICKYRDYLQNKKKAQPL